MPNFDIDELHDLEDEHGGATQDSWRLGYDQSWTRWHKEEQHHERIVV